MEFDKYKQLGDYHWKCFEKQDTYGKHAKFVSDWVREGRTLDIGAGDGLITHLLGCEGIDDNELAVQLAQGHGSNVIFGSAYNLGYPPGSFDNVLMADVIEHLKTPDAAINEVRRVLKTGGYFYVTTPPALRKGLHDKYHYREYTPSSLISFLKGLRFNLVGEISIKHVRMYAIFKKSIV